MSDSEGEDMIDFVSDCYDDQEKRIIIRDNTLTPAASSQIIRYVQTAQVHSCSTLYFRNWRLCKYAEIKLGWPPTTYDLQVSDKAASIDEEENVDRAFQGNSFEELTKLSAPLLNNVTLRCILDEQNWRHFSKVDWPLVAVNVEGCLLGQRECEILSEAKWSHNSMDLSHNSIDAFGVKSLSESSWAALLNLSLTQNIIGDEGCKHIVFGPWNLHRLNIGQNMISKVGCKWLSKANWKELNFLAIDGNFVDWEGIKYLSTCSWDALYEILIDENELGSEGLKKLYTFQSPNLIQLSIDCNDIDEDSIYLQELSNAHNKLNCEQNG